MGKHQAEIADLTTTDASVPAAAANYPPVTIIVGTGRCGTEYLQHLMRVSFGIGFPAEPKFVQKFYFQLEKLGQTYDVQDMELWARRISATHSVRHLERIRRVKIAPQDILAEATYGNTYTSLLYGFLQCVAKIRGEHNLGYKDPLDVDAIPILLDLFPSAKIINLVRDGRDVACSFLRFAWGPKNFYTAARFWKKMVDQSRQDGARAGNRYLELRFEDLILKSEAVAQQLFEFLDHLEITSAQQDAFLQTLNSTKQEGSLNRWKQNASEHEIRVFESIAFETLQDLGYELHCQDRMEFNAWADLRYRSDHMRKKLAKYIWKFASSSKVWPRFLVARSHG